MIWGRCSKVGAAWRPHGHLTTDFTCRGRGEAREGIQERGFALRGLLGERGNINRQLGELGCAIRILEFGMKLDHFCGCACKGKVMRGCCTGNGGVSDDTGRRHGTTGKSKRMSNYICPYQDDQERQEDAYAGHRWARKRHQRNSIRQ